MRAIAATDALREYGPAIESAWIGHGQAIAVEHYSIVRDSDFKEAINRTSNLTQTAQCSALQYPVQNLSEVGGFEQNQEEAEDEEFPSIPLESPKDNPLLSQGVTFDGRSWIRTNVGNRQRVYSPSHLAALAFALNVIFSSDCSSEAA